MMYAILHNIRSLHNVGSIFRTADAAGVEKLYLCGITGTPPRKEIAKVALGAEQTVAWEYVRRTGDVIKRLRKQGVRIVALERTKNSIDYRKVLPLLKGEGGGEVKMALLVGNEVEGLPPALLRQADTVIHIPMRGKKESLNVSVAFGIAIYQLILDNSSQPPLTLRGGGSPS
ncbi:RNA methyltransferase [Candidatus Uhrbacteria bacterium]|nr:RNA methyltransferase [Candidatus Uhrbacteria bacterium]